MSTAGLIRIGELSRRAGVSVDRLRAWERRYGLLDPVRTPGGFRLYSPADEARIRAMREQLAAGVSAAQAASAVLAPVGGDVPVPARRAELAAALTGFDEPRALRALDGLFAELGDEPAVDAVIFPVMRRVGEGWASGELHVGQEHFATTLVEARLLERLRALGDPGGPPALLACAPGERHTLGLIGLAIALRRRGRSVTYLGADTPVPDLMRSIEQLDPAVVVLSAVMAGRFHNVEAQLREVGARVPLALGGPGAARAVADRIGARRLEGDPLTAADALTR